MRIRCLRGPRTKRAVLALSAVAVAAAATSVDLPGWLLARTARSWLGRATPANCRFLGRLYFYAAALLPARSKWAGQAIARAPLVSGTCMPERKRDRGWIMATSRQVSSSAY